MCWLSEEADISLDALSAERLLSVRAERLLILTSGMKSVHCLCSGDVISIQLSEDLRCLTLFPRQPDYKSAADLDYWLVALCGST